MKTSILEITYRACLPVIAAGILWTGSNLYGLRQSIAENKISSQHKFQELEGKINNFEKKLDKLDVWMDKINSEFAVVADRQAFYLKSFEEHTKLER